MLSVNLPTLLPAADFKSYTYTCPARQPRHADPHSDTEKPMPEASIPKTPRPALCRRFSVAPMMDWRKLSVFIGLQKYRAQIMLTF